MCPLTRQGARGQEAQVEWYYGTIIEVRHRYAYLIRYDGLDGRWNQVVGHGRRSR